MTLTNTEISQGGIELLTELGIESQAVFNSLPYLSQFQRGTLITVLIGLAVLLTFLFVGTLVFFLRRKKLYQQAGKVIENYINGDFSLHLPQNSEGAIFLYFLLLLSSLPQCFKPKVIPTIKQRNF